MNDVTEKIKTPSISVRKFICIGRTKSATEYLPFEYNPLINERQVRRWFWRGSPPWCWSFLFQLLGSQKDDQSPTSNTLKSNFPPLLYIQQCTFNLFFEAASFYE